MKQFVFAFVVFLLWSVVGTWYYSCKLKNLCLDQTEEVEKVEVTSFIGFIGQKGVAEIEEIETTSIKEDLYNMLKESQDKVLHIDAYFDTEMEDSAIADNRAKKMIELLSSYGINASRMKYDVVPKAQLFKNDIRTNQAFKFDLEELTKEDIEMIESSIKSKTLYAEFGSGEFIPDRTLIAYVEELKYYLSTHPEEVVEVIGHTDNVGAAQANFELGKRRAENVKEYMTAQGIASAKIKVLSKGQDSPIADNATDAGRKQNRRIEIKVN